MTNATLEQTLQVGVAHLSEHHNVCVPEEACERLLRYVELLAKWNRVYNLTAVRDQYAMVNRHLLDSLVLLRWMPERVAQSYGQTESIVDIGSGAGLPVLPLAIVRPDLHFVSIESNGKKTRFQQHVMMDLRLENVQLLNKRVEDVSIKASFLTSRAFTAPEDFLRICRPLCAEQAKVAVMLAHTDTLPEPMPSTFRLEELVPVDIPGSSGPRHVALCRHYP